MIKVIYMYEVFQYYVVFHESVDFSSIINLITIAVINLRSIVVETRVPRATDSREGSFLRF